MTLRLPLSGKRHATIVSAYAPTMTNPDEVKDKFYDDLNSVISATHRTDKLILLGDFKARVGTDHQTWKGVIGTEEIGKCNSNGLLLLKKCAEHELLITNIVFYLPTHDKTRPSAAVRPSTFLAENGFGHTYIFLLFSPVLRFSGQKSIKIDNLGVPLSLI